MVADRIIFAVTLVLAAVYFYATAQIPSLDIGDPLGPKAFPRLLGICLLISAALLLVEMIKKGKAAAPEAAEAPHPERNRHLAIIVAVVIWTCLYYWVFEMAGYILSTAVYLLPLMAFFNRGKWMANVLTAVLFSIGTYALFAKVLKVTLAKGLVHF